MKEESYRIQAILDTVMCHKSEMNLLKRDFRKFCDAIDSAPVRYTRILDSHPYITKRQNHELSFGYIIDYPKALFRCEYIIRLLYHHIEVCTFSQHALESFVKLRCMSTGLNKVYNVSLIIYMFLGIN